MSKFGDGERIVADAERQRKRLWGEFERVRPKLAEIARYIYPNALGGLTRDVKDLGAESEYDADDAERFTGVPFDAFKIAVGGFYTNLTNPSAPWFSLGSPSFGRGGDSREDYFAKEYARLTEATRWLMGWCGCYRALHLVYKHLLAFGFGAIVVDSDEERVARAQCLRMGTYALGIDRRGRVDRVVRHFAFTAEQMLEEFGAERLPANVMEAARRGDCEARFEVWNIIEPHRRLAGVRTPHRLSYRRFPYRSVYWTREGDNGDHGLLAVRGYLVRPIVAPRLTFEVGDVYGRGCGHDALGHCKALQTMAESNIDIADQEAHPSLMAPASLADAGLRLGAWDVNWYPDGLGPDAVYRALGDPPKGERTVQEMQRLEAEVRKIFFNSEFETINAMEDNAAFGGGGGNMTATEVKARVNEKMEQLAGIATTLNDELLDPFVTIMATYALMSGLVEADLPSAGGAPLPWDIKYESAIHAAANAQPINAAVSALGVAAQLAQATGDASVFDNFDADEAARDVHRKLGAPERYLRAEWDRDAVRQARAEEAARERQMQEEAVGARALKDAASAPITPGTIGGAIAEAGQGM